MLNAPDVLQNVQFDQHERWNGFYVVIYFYFYLYFGIN